MSTADIGSRRQHCSSTRTVRRGWSVYDSIVYFNQAVAELADQPGRKASCHRIIRRRGADQTEGVIHTKSVAERIRLRRPAKIFQHSIPLEI